MPYTLVLWLIVYSVISCLIIYNIRRRNDSLPSDFKFGDVTGIIESQSGWRLNEDIQISDPVSFGE